jgi:uncharacterized glyoxalase superfamily protein PhnB
MQWSPHLGFNGECEVAFKFYEKRLGAKITCMTPPRARLLRKRRQFIGITTSAPRRRSRRPGGLSLLL